MLKNKISPLHKEQGKDTNFQGEGIRFYRLLQDKTASATMVEDVTGIKQKYITQYKRRLERQGLLWVVFEGRCKYTKRLVQYITTNLDLVPDLPKQLKLEL